jgi:hypothetical protein
MVLVVGFCTFGNIVCPCTMLVVAAIDARIRVMIDTIVNRSFISISCLDTFTS